MSKWRVKFVFQLFGCVLNVFHLHESSFHPFSLLFYFYFPLIVIKQIVSDTFLLYSPISHVLKSFRAPGSFGKLFSTKDYCLAIEMVIACSADQPNGQKANCLFR